MLIVAYYSCCKHYYIKCFNYNFVVLLLGGTSDTTIVRLSAKYNERNCSGQENDHSFPPRLSPRKKKERILKRKRKN